jgi:hypothetical protein
MDPWMICSRSWSAITCAVVLPSTAAKSPSGAAIDIPLISRFAMLHIF